MQRHFSPAAAVAFLAVAHLFGKAATQGAFTLEGFRLGMPWEEAKQVHPEVPWEDEELPFGLSYVTLKEFPSSHLGHAAMAQVQLDPSGQVVGVIAFKYKLSSQKACETQAEQDLSSLNVALGKPSQSLHVPLRLIQWNSQPGVSTTVTISCKDGSMPTASPTRSVMANLSVKGTSCGKPQAAPYLER